MAVGGAVLLLSLGLYILCGPQVASIRVPAAERMPTFSGRPFWRASKQQRLGLARDATQLPALDAQLITSSVKFAEAVVGRLGRLEQTLAGADVRVRPGSPAHGQLIAVMPSQPALERHRAAQVALRASQFIADNNCRKYNLKERRCGELVSSQSLADSPLGSSCQLVSELSCSESRYRTMDGTCNNPAHPAWGAALTALRRELKPQYADGLQSPRGTNKLPSARAVSAALAPSSSESRTERDVTLAVVQWAQLVSADLAQTPAAKMAATGSSIVCCKRDGGALPPRSRHPSCAPISVASDDPVFRGRRCLEYVRSLLAPRPDCRFGPAEQMNQATHWLDGSAVYGSSEAASRELRHMAGGRLKVSLGSQGPRGLLPLHEDPTAGCQVTTKPLGACFKAGDSRVNEQPAVTALHTVLLREHNRVAGALQSLNPRWSDERLFQEARRVLVAQIQHVTYTHWLPALLGRGYASSSPDYSASVDPALRNSVATAALHFSLSMMAGTLDLHDESRRNNGSLRLRDHYNRPAVLQEPGRLDLILRAVTTQRSEVADLLHTAEVTAAMYAGEGGDEGLDALSVLIQRGRDHGLPGYNSFRAACGLPSARSIDDLADLIPRSVVAQLQAVYSKPDDVDLYVGAMAERAAQQDSLLGPTFRCLLARQFRDTRRADRYFYDVRDQPGSFTSEQLAEIKKSSLARLFCDNGDDIRSMQRDVFFKPTSRRAGHANELTPCSALPVMDLTPWRES